ncbi:MAG: autotransporter domain-containing protein [Magnetococcales bacterium]|nr:autotransporter domain-containing protein [Magnetococcales bacterium]
MKLRKNLLAASLLGLAAMIGGGATAQAAALTLTGAGEWNDAGTTGVGAPAGGDSVALAGKQLTISFKGATTGGPNVAVGAITDATAGGKLIISSNTSTASTATVNASIASISVGSDAISIAGSNSKAGSVIATVTGGLTTTGAVTVTAGNGHYAVDTAALNAINAASFLTNLTDVGASAGAATAARAAALAVINSTGYISGTVSNAILTAVNANGGVSLTSNNLAAQAIQADLASATKTVATAITTAMGYTTPASASAAATAASLNARNAVAALVGTTNYTSDAVKSAVSAAVLANGGSSAAASEAAQLAYNAMVGVTNASGVSSSGLAYSTLTSNLGLSTVVSTMVGANGVATPAGTPITPGGTFAPAAAVASLGVPNAYLQVGGDIKTGGMTLVNSNSSPVGGSAYLQIVGTAGQTISGTINGGTTLPNTGTTTGEIDIAAGTSAATPYVLGTVSNSGTVTFSDSIGQTSSLSKIAITSPGTVNFTKDVSVKTLSITGGTLAQAVTVTDAATIAGAVPYTAGVAGTTTVTVSGSLTGQKTSGGLGSVSLSITGGVGTTGGPAAAAGGAGGAVTFTAAQLLVGSATVAGGAGGQGGLTAGFGVGGVGGSATATFSGGMFGSLTVKAGAAGSKGTTGILGGAGGNATATVAGSVSNGVTMSSVAGETATLNLVGASASIGAVSVGSAGTQNICVGSALSCGIGGGSATNASVTFLNDVGGTTNTMTTFQVQDGSSVYLTKTGGTTIKATNDYIGNGSKLYISGGTLVLTGTNLDLSHTAAGTSQLFINMPVSAMTNGTVINATGVGTAGTIQTGIVNVVPNIAMTSGSITLVDTNNAPIAGLASGAVATASATRWTVSNTALATYTISQNASNDLILTAAPVTNLGTVASTLKVDQNTAGVLRSIASGLSGQAQSNFGTILTTKTGSAIVDAVNKARPDSAGVSAATTTAANTITNVVVGHQGEMVASMGSFGLQKYVMTADASSPTGVSSGGSALSKNLWVKGFGSHSDQDTRDGITGYSSGVLGAAFGIDGKMDDNKLVGISFSYANVNVDGNNAGQSNTKSDVNQLTAYGTLLMKEYYINGSVGYAHGENTTKRATLVDTAVGTYNSDTMSASIGAGMPKDFGTYALIPQTNLAYSHIESAKYTENGASPLTVTPGDLDVLHWTAGVAAISKSKQSTYTMATGAHLMADWDVTQAKVEGASQYGSGTPFQTNGAKPAALGGIGGLNLDIASNDGVYGVSVGYDANFRPDFISHTGEVKFRMSF